MNSVIYLLLRRLRWPLITLIVVYAISITGFVLIPGMDDKGQPWQMGFFHAFYFVSFMGSTIGFGEIPYAFTDAQRYWAMLTIYVTVIAWLYGIGTMLAILQDQAFSRMRARQRFRNAVKAIQEPFYLICGYGVTGSLLVNKLASRGIQAVVVDINQQRIDDLLTDTLPMAVPALCADACEPDILTDAGLLKQHCIGVVALTNSDEVNLAVAIASKLLATRTPVISRAESQAINDNLASFGTEHIVNPFESFAEYLAMAIHSPYKHLVYDWLVNPRHRPAKIGAHQVQGTWVICGYGRMGQALHRYLGAHQVDMVVIDEDPAKFGMMDDMVLGLGTEAVTLQEARIAQAVGVVAGTASDANNLSILMTARMLNPELITVARQNQRYNERVFQAACPDYVMEPAWIIANKIMLLIKTPLLLDFLRQMGGQSDAWAQQLIERMREVVDDQELDSWSLTIDQQEAPAIMTALTDRQSVPLGVLQVDPRQRLDALKAFPLMIKRSNGLVLLPTTDTLLQEGDVILFCGRYRASALMQWTAGNYNVLRYVRDGFDGASGYVWRWLSKSYRERRKMSHEIK
ncbi:potassium transporter TrkA [Pokkaliibacter plantistimulans]|uniref:Potassium transporter TrkA n=1 Tax=Pokkaliibacter plantistimulans TaxID=1635171 RepID=A0ABX5LT75_9GAMM|nr:NAD-binding protein [Pokkaliibacter plantistimulans]PXF29339.1 potassium transporter TrkA [Pokkaliibacter plantistimulans]